MDAFSHMSRRKACDLCFIKKIKCDMLKPHCSNCRQYKAECKTTPVRRRAGHSRKPAPVAASATTTVPCPSPTQSGDPRAASTTAQHQPDRTEVLEARLVRIEEQLQHVISLAAAALGGDARAKAAPARESTDEHDWFGIREFVPTPPGSGSGTLPSLAGDEPIVDVGTEDADPAEWVNRPSCPKLPPLERVLPLVDRYFENFNSIIPLFSQPAFMRMLNQWYAWPQSRQRAVWAAINIVMALGSSIPEAPSDELNVSGDHPCLKGCMENAQSVLAELVTRDEDLLGVQVLLGLVLLFRHANDPRPATVLIGAAVRLVHRLRFQSKEDIEALYPPEEGLHRSRLFWIAYALDKEISLRHQTPPVQLDADIDLDLPSASPPDGVGDIYTSDGSVRVNYLRLRVRLAHIAGRTYDLLYSTRSSKVPPLERQARVLKLRQQLESWWQSIPPEMRPEGLRTHGTRLGLIYMTTIYCQYLMTLSMVAGIWSTYADWNRVVSRYGRAALQAGDTEGPRRCYSAHQGMPGSWRDCVPMSRECLKLFRRMPQGDCNIWGNTCALFTSAVVLLSYACERPGDPNAIEDKELAGYSISILNEAKKFSLFVPLENLNVVLVEMSDRADAALLQAAAEKERLAAEQEVLEYCQDEIFPLPIPVRWDPAEEMTSDGALICPERRDRGLEMGSQVGPFGDWMVCR